MTGGDVAALIAAVAFAVLVAVLAVPLFKLARLIDEARVSLRDVSDDLAPLIDETTQTVAEAGRQLSKVDGVTTNLVHASEGITGVVSSLTQIVNSPLARIASLVGGLRRGRKRK